MTIRPRWRDAEVAADELANRPSDRRTLLLLARLPLLPERVLERLAGVSGGAGVYRALRRLADAGLIAAMQPSIQPGHSPRLWYLTDLGLAVVALDQGVAVEQLARHNRLRGADLLALLPGLPHLLAVHDLLAAVAAARPGQPDLLAWERPWRRRYQRPTAKRPVIVSLPAYAALAWDGETGRYLLLPDLATYPVRHHRATLDQLFALRRYRVGDLPPLVVATGDAGRVAAWQELLEETRQQRAEDPLAVCVATWTNLLAAPETLISPSGVAGPPIEQVVQRVRLPPGQQRRHAAQLPRLIGDELTGRAAQPHTSQSLGRIALGLTMTDRMLLDLVGRHPFLTPDRLAIVLGGPVQSVRRRRNRLISLGLMRLLASGEIDREIAALDLVELTAEGLTLCAAQQGLSLAAAVRVNGLAGGGPERPIGVRRMLLAQLVHTLGVDGIFISLIRPRRHLAATGRDDGLVEWQNAAACNRRHLRPDGYGIYRYRGRLYGFFLEYDRGTMSARDYRRKFAAYYAYWTSGRFERDYYGFPTILVVTIDNATEARIASAARTASAGHAVAPPVLLTCQWRIDDARNLDGLFGRIWREPTSEIDERRLWPMRHPGVAELPASSSRRG